MLELINAKSNKKKITAMEDQKQSSHAPTNSPTMRFCFVQINEIFFFFSLLNGVGTHNLFQLQTVNERLEIYLIYIDKDGNAEE